MRAPVCDIEPCPVALRSPIGRTRLQFVFVRFRSRRGGVRGEVPTIMMTCCDEGDISVMGKVSACPSVVLNGWGSYTKIARFCHAQPNSTSRITSRLDVDSPLTCFSRASNRAKTPRMWAAAEEKSPVCDCGRIRHFVAHVREVLYIWKDHLISKAARGNDTHVGQQHRVNASCDPEWNQY